MREGYCKSHIETHPGNKPYRCNTCPNAFWLEENLADHTKNSHTVEDLCCHICNKTYKDKGHFHQHIRFTHSGETHPCPYCKKAYKKQGHFKNHIETHPGDKPYKCKDCPNTFWLEENFSDHTQQHHTVKVEYFDCHNCCATNMEKQSFKKHKRSHCRYTDP